MGISAPPTPVTDRQVGLFLLGCMMVGAVVGGLVALLIDQVRG
jgi:uncharacterized membrane protein YfcA